MRGNPVKLLTAAVLSAFALGLPLALSACERDSAERAGQKAGEKIDDARDRARDTIHDAARDVEKKTDR